MFDFIEELQGELDAIASGGTSARPPDWRKTKILNNEGGILADARKFLEADWWKRAEPRDASNREILRMVERGQLRMGDGKEEENQQFVGSGTPVTAGEIAEHQRDKAKRRRERSAVDEGEEWREYLGSPGDDARAWLKDLSVQVDTNAGDNKGWWGTLRDHVYGKPDGAKIRELDPRIVEFCLQNLCTE